MDLKFKSAHFVFSIVLINFRSSSALWKCEKAIGFSKSLWKMWERPPSPLGWKAASQLVKGLINLGKTFPCFPQCRHFHKAWVE
jgi:hypothetical protein